MLKLFVIALITIASLSAEPINDGSGLNATEIDQLFLVPQEDNLIFLRQTIKKARDFQIPISIRGIQHSQGGHTFYSQGMVLDLSNLNAMRLIKPNVLRVQAGASWKQVIEFLNPLHLSVDIMQSDYDFSVGGSISTNVHGWPANKAPIISTVQGLHLLLADGSLVYCSRSENVDLFRAVIGGYGLLGIIVDVDLLVTPDSQYKLKQKVIKPNQFHGYFQKLVQNNRQARMFFGRFSLENSNFLERIVFRVYEDTEELAKNSNLHSSRIVEFIFRWLFNMTIKSDFYKHLRWRIETSDLVAKLFGRLSRNQLLYHSVNDYLGDDVNSTDLLQEYFVPIEHFDEFTHYLKTLQPELIDSLMNITVRYVKKDELSLLNYAPQDMLCFVMFFRGPRTAQFDNYLRQLAIKITGKALELGGSYYLPYRPYQTKEQFKQAYPNYAQFKQIKERYDPDEVFKNKFYENYIINEE